MEIEVVVNNEHGLHARPAAAFVQEAARYRASIKLLNLTTGRGPAPATSLLAVLALGVRRGHSVRLLADGPEAERCLTSLARLISSEAPPEDSAGGPREGGRI